jgi:hypothetical protein
VVDTDNLADPVLDMLARHVLLVQIRGTEAHADELARRFEKAPKPMYYPENFLRDVWADYLAETGTAEDRVDPDRFMAWGFRRLLAHRLPRYDAIAERWGVMVEAAEIEALQSPVDFDALIAEAIRRR